MSEDPSARSYENPSAGRFDPSVPAATKPEAWNGTRIIITLLVLGVGCAQYWLRSHTGGGWLAAAVAIAALALVGAEFVMLRKAADERADGPYSPPNHLTR